MTEAEKQFTAAELEAAKQEAINKANSDHEQWVQKLISEKKFAETILDAVGEVAKDSTNLINIFDENPEVANEILKKYYGWQTIDEYKEAIGFKEQPEQLNEKMIVERATSIVNANKIKDTKKAFIEKVWLEGEELKAFEEEFDERLQLKSFDIEKLDEHITKAYKLATGYSAEQIKEIQKSKIIASASSMSGSDKSKADSKAQSKKEVDDLLDGRI